MGTAQGRLRVERQSPAEAARGSRRVSQVLPSEVLKRFVKESAVTVMVRVAMENALSPEALDALFERTAERQYTRELLFSTMVDLMSTVVCGARPSVHAAYQAVVERLPTSITAVYNKLDGLEPKTSAALVRHTAERLQPVITAMERPVPRSVAGVSPEDPGRQSPRRNGTAVESPPSEQSRAAARAMSGGPGPCADAGRRRDPVRGWTRAGAFSDGQDPGPGS